MKKIPVLKALSIVVLFAASCTTPDENTEPEVFDTDPDCSQIIAFADPAFKAKLLSATASLDNVVAVGLDNSVRAIDTNNDGEIQVCEAEKVARLTVDDAEISSLSGIKEFRNLYSLSCKYNNIGQIDVSGMVKLTHVYAPGNQLTSINLDQLDDLEVLDVESNQLTSLNLSGRPKLREVIFRLNQVSNLNIANSNNIVKIDGSHNALTSLSVNQLDNLETLYISHNQLTSLTIGSHENIKFIQCDGNSIATLDVSNSPKLLELTCYNNQLTSLAVQNCPLLSYLNASTNALTSINLNGLNDLYNISLSANELTQVDVRNSPNLHYLDFYNNNLQSLIIKNGRVHVSCSIGMNPNLSTICCDADEQASILTDIALYGYDCAVASDCF